MARYLKIQTFTIYPAKSCTMSTYIFSALIKRELFLSIENRALSCASDGMCLFFYPVKIAKKSLKYRLGGCFYAFNATTNDLELLDINDDRQVVAVENSSASDRPTPPHVYSSQTFSTSELQNFLRKHPPFSLAFLSKRELEDVLAGNPGDTAPSDLVFAETTFQFPWMYTLRDEDVRIDDYITLTVFPSASPVIDLSKGAPDSELPPRNEHGIVANTNGGASRGVATDTIIPNEYVGTNYKILPSCPPYWKIGASSLIPLMFRLIKLYNIPSPFKDVKEVQSWLDNTKQSTGKQKDPKKPSQKGK